MSKCQLCGNKLTKIEYLICRRCDAENDKYRVWKGRKLSFNSEPLAAAKTRRADKI